MNRTLSPNSSILTVTSIGLTALMFGLEISSVPIILPSLEKLMSTTFGQLQWIMNAYTIASTVVLMATGSLADRYGRKKLYVLSIALFGLSSLACGLASGVEMLIVSRFLQGVGGGAMLICQIAVLSYAFQDGKKRSVAFSIWGIVFGAGLGLGPVVGAAIMAVANWQWVFLIHVVISCLAIVFVTRGVHESRSSVVQSINIRSMLLLSTAVFGLTFYITHGSEQGFTTAFSFITLLGTVIFFLLFLWNESKSRYPMFDFKVFRVRTFSGALLGSMAMNFSFWPFMIYFPLYFQYCLGYDVMATGACMLAYTLPTLIVPPFAERLVLKFRPGVIIPAGMFTIGLGFVIMRYSMGLDGASWLTVIPGVLIAGMGLGLTNTPVTNTTTSALPTDMAGMASGIDMSARLITLAVNIAIMGFLLVAGIYAYLHAAAPDGGDISQLYAMAEKIAAGKNVSNVPAILNSKPAVVKSALVNGFCWVVLYAGIAAIGLAIISFIVFANPQGRKES